MTFITLAALGLGVLLIISAIENCSIITTLQDIIAGKQIDISGNACSGSSTP